MDGRPPGLRHEGGFEFAVVDGVEDGGAECAADGAGGETETRCSGEEGVPGGELDQGYEEG